MQDIIDQFTPEAVEEMMATTLSLIQSCILISSTIHNSFLAYA